MGIKDAFDNIVSTVSNAAETAIANVKDAASEATHHAAAQAEQTKRDVAGDALTPGEHIESVATQVKEETLAQVDAAKQEIRSNI
jgi:N-acetylglucosamine kinase-like BadF-type ATPase